MQTANLLLFVAYYLIGCTIMAVAIMVWATHPVNRAFVAGPYLTAEGAKAAIRLLPFVFLVGIFVVVDGLKQHLRWLADGGGDVELILLFVTWVQAGISVITASIILAVMCRWGVKRWYRN